MGVHRNMNYNSYGSLEGSVDCIYVKGKQHKVHVLGTRGCLVNVSMQKINPFVW